MPAVTIARPDASEYAEYFGRYVSKVPEGDVLALLTRQIDETTSMLGALNNEDAEYRYGPDKWSIKEVVGHMADTERIFVYRALCFARRETVALPGFDENAYVANTSFDDRPLADLLGELRAVRAATIAFFKGLTDAELDHRGTANDREYTVRAIAYIVAGHERHHSLILRERYLSAEKQSA
ncbi:MAG: DinB family protein [Gemmatimonadaceae bacterium]